MRIPFLRPIAAGLAVIATVTFQPLAIAAGANGNIVTAVVNAPVAANGIIGDEPSEFQVWLNAPRAPSREYDFDPRFFGHQIPAGGRMEVTLGGSFERNPAFVGEMEALFHAAVLNGHQHNPIVPGAGAPTHHGNWVLEDSGGMSFSVVPLGGAGRNGLEGDRARKIGLKHLHIRPDPRDGASLEKAPFLNGPAGSVGTVEVRILDSRGEVREQGHGSVVFHSRLGRIAGINNIGVVREPILEPDTLNDPIESVNWQHVPPGAELVLTEALPEGVDFFSQGYYAPRFIMIERHEDQPDSYFPYELIPGVSYTVNPDAPWQASLTENGTVIGAIVIDGPATDSRGELLPPLEPTTDDLLSRLLVPCRVGEQPGLYRLTVTLLDGGSTTVHVVVEPGSGS